MIKSLQRRQRYDVEWDEIELSVSLFSQCVISHNLSVHTYLFSSCSHHPPFCPLNPFLSLFSYISSFLPHIFKPCSHFILPTSTSILFLITVLSVTSPSPPPSQTLAPPISLIVLLLLHPSPPHLKCSGFFS